MPIDETKCKWCDIEHHCDCIERMNCAKAGQPGHHYCGTRPCGAPRFLICTCQKCTKKDEMEEKVM